MPTTGLSTNVRMHSVEGLQDVPVMGKDADVWDCQSRMPSQDFQVMTTWFLCCRNSRNGCLVQGDYLRLAIHIAR